jgi:hypothetical protein
MGFPAGRLLRDKAPFIGFPETADICFFKSAAFALGPLFGLVGCLNSESSDWSYWLSTT